MAPNDIRQADMAATKYLFDLSFDDQAPSEPEHADADLEPQPDMPPPPPPPEPTFSEAELNAARDQAFQEGQAAGHNEAGAGIEQRIANALDLMTEKLGGLQERQEEHNRTALKDLIALNARILEVLLPAYVQRHGIDEIDALVSDCLGRVLDPGQIVIDVPAETAESLEDRLRQSAERAGFTGALDIRASADLSGADVRLTWQDGGAARVTEEIWSEIKNAIGRTIHSLEPAADTDAEVVSDTEPEAAGPAPTEDAGEPNGVMTADPTDGEAPEPTTEPDDITPRPDAAPDDASAAPEQG